MVAQTSTMVPLGTPAPPFSLPEAEGGTLSLQDLSRAQALVVMFICNHCPYVKHLRADIARLADDYQPRGVAIVGINSNDGERYPDDGFAAMAAEKRSAGYRFPYAHDADQSVAKAYRAACTPDFFLYDQARKLYYRGQFDDSRPKNALPVTGKDLRTALDSCLAGLPAPSDQRPSMGCNIKWKPGAEPAWFPVAR
ncbi:MAG: thioredoxin family protein [Planctomycetes bacterium]|nr:thioredoxin family protein [Planctomycetota bacterium]